MKKIITAIIIGCTSFGIYVPYIPNTSIAVANDIDKIIKAKEIIRNMVNYPDTLVFHEFYTQVKGNTVTLKFTCKNAFGVSETHVIDVKVN